MVIPAITPADRLRIAEAVRSAEAKTAAEIVVVVETESCEETDATIALIAAGLIAIAAAGPLSWLKLPFEAIVLGQAALFGVLAAFASSSRVRDAIGIDRLASGAAHKAAERAFEELGLHKTHGRTGVLIHVAVADRHVEVIADEGVHEAVAPETWTEEVELVVSAARQGRLVEGIVAAVERCGAALAEALPPVPGLGDELPDEPVVR